VATRYKGKICDKHPELKGQRIRATGGTSRCPKCSAQKVHRGDKRLRQTVLNNLGKVCTLCGVDDPDVLSINHTNGGGADERRELEGKRTKMARVAHRQGTPKDKYRVLCFNCDIKAHHYMRRTGAVLMTRPNYTPLRALQQLVTSWADAVYPDRTLESILMKLREEAQELLEKPVDGLEVADVVICLLDLASRTGVDVYEATHRKIQINSTRKWKINKTTGIMRHTNEE